MRGSIEEDNQRDEINARGWREEQEQGRESARVDEAYDRYSMAGNPLNEGDAALFSEWRDLDEDYANDAMAGAIEDDRPNPERQAKTRAELRAKFEEAYGPLNTEGERAEDGRCPEAVSHARDAVERLRDQQAGQDDHLDHDVESDHDHDDAHWRDDRGDEL